MPAPPRLNIWSNVWRSLAAILIGNALYFLLIAPRLPPSGQHRPFAIDWGLVIDFWVCLVVYGLIDLILKRRKKRRKIAE
ncbi:MAG TPA: hypothetical protein VD837_11210 [Terriglobales bacterium]|nr:hypothetical protein [Terriglobales bacterium]